MSVNPLYIGDLAPSFPRLEFIKGQEFREFRKGEIYVLECWATWCGPCLNSIPHLNQLQEKYPEITVLGAAVWESDIDTVRQFIKEHDSEMNYTIAFNPAGTEESPGDIPRDWLQPFWQEGIPTAFLIDTAGRIAWFGHPLEIDQPLAELVAGTLDITLAAEKYRIWIKENKVEEAYTLDKKMREFLSKEDTSGAISACNEAFAQTPELENLRGAEKFALLLRQNDALRALNYARHLVVQSAKPSEQLYLELGYIICGQINSYTESNERDLLLSFALENLLNAEKQAKENNDVMSLSDISSGLAALKSKQEAWQETLKYAEEAISYARQAEKDEGFIQYLCRQLEIYQQQTLAATDKKNGGEKKVKCDGENCWIE